MHRPQEIRRSQAVLFWSWTNRGCAAVVHGSPWLRTGPGIGASALATNVHRVLTCCGESATLDLAGAGRV